MSRPLLLDLFCGAGGASKGYQRAGFEVVGVDIKPQPHYCGDEFIQADALVTLDELVVSRPDWAREFDAIHASPPCQRYTALGTREDLSGYADLMAPTRALLEAAGLPWVIENVPGAPMRPDVVLCGNSFGLRVYRHRFFECSFPVTRLVHQEHRIRVNRRGENRLKHWQEGGFLTVTGDIGSYAGAAMGIDWMTGNELSQAIPPVYTDWIGRQLVRELARNAA